MWRGMSASQCGADVARKKTEALACRLLRVRDSGRCARRGPHGSQPRHDLSRQGPLGGLFGAERTVLVDGDLERGTEPPA